MQSVTIRLRANNEIVKTDSVNDTTKLDTTLEMSNAQDFAVWEGLHADPQLELHIE